MAYVTIASTDYDPDSPITTTLAGAWSNNLAEAFAGASGAPKVALSALFAYSAGSRTVASKTGLETASLTYVKKAEFYIPRSGTIRVRLAITIDHSGSVIIYKNGSPVGTDRTASGTYDEDISVSAGDLLQVYMKSGSAIYPVYVAVYLRISNPLEPVDTSIG